MTARGMLLGGKCAAMVALVRFGVFELDVHSRELRKSGIRLHLPDQSFEILALLVERPGDVITREEIRERLWPHGTVVEFEHSVNSAVKRLRRCLGDSPIAPRFIETLPKRGYRFIAPVEIGVAPRSTPHFRILGEAGRGRMGVVYRAEDLILGRTVALKFLPEELAHDPRAVERLRHEARALASLNHPGICALYGIEEHEGRLCLVMEYLEGQPLSRLIEGGPLALKQALKIAEEASEALGAAHSRGIVHHDVTPANIFVTREGRVKILDFGLAKATRRESTQEETTPTSPGPAIPSGDLTTSGALDGTTGYISPEQVRGEAADARSDLFSLGVVLYEMLCGRHPFNGNSAGSRLTEVRPEQAPLPTELRYDIPKNVERVLLRCLEKAPEARYASAVELHQQLKACQASAQGRDRRRVAAAATLVAGAALLLLVATVAVWRHLRILPPEQEARVTVLTSFPGMQGTPAFSPDGSQVAFSWVGEKQDNTDIYVKVVGAETALRLTTHSAADSFPAWSPDGRSIAFLRRTSRRPATIYKVSPLGGPERKVADVIGPDWSGTASEKSGLCWSRDGKWILSSDADSPEKPSYIVLVSSDTGEKRKLTSGEGLSECCPALSPDQRLLAFVRRVADQQSRLFVLSLDAGLKPTAAARQLRPAGSFDFDPIWTGDGKSLLFVSTDSEIPTARLWRVSASGDSPPALVPEAGEGVFSPALSPHGERLVFTHFFVDVNIWQLDVSGPGGRAGTPRQVVASTREDRRPAFSPDGRRIAFESSRSGYFGIWLANADGSNPQPLYADPNDWSESPVWSPDGHTIAFGKSQNRLFQVFLMSPEGGAPRRLADHPWEHVLPSWSHDGKWVYFSSLRTGRSEVWKAPAAGGAAVQLTRNGGFMAQESLDGTTLFFVRSRLSHPSTTSLWKMPVEGGEETKVLDSVGTRNWAPVDEGLWFINWTKPDDAALQFLEFATGKIIRVAPIDRPPAIGLAVSPDGRTILYAEYDQRGSELILVENFR